MREYRADRRRTRFEEQPEAHQAVSVLGPLTQELFLGLARQLRTIDATAAYLRTKCGTIGQYGAQYGLSRQITNLLRYVGWAMYVFDWVEPGIRRGEFSFDEARELGRLGIVHALDPRGALEEGDDWRHCARYEGLRVLRSKIRHRIEILRQGRHDLRPFCTHITPEAFEDYLRAQQLASNKARTKLTRGQTVAAVLRDYVHRHDPNEKGTAKRRMGDTSDPKRRGIPAETLRACQKAYGDRCWVPGCDEDVCLEHMHVKPKRDGGSQEPENIGRGCHRHHVMHDAGEIWIIGKNAQDLPIFETKEGEVLHPEFPHRPLRKAKGGEPREDAETPPDPSGEGVDRVAELGASWNDARVPRADGWSTRSAPPYAAFRPRRAVAPRAQARGPPA